MSNLIVNAKAFDRFGRLVDEYTAEMSADDFARMIDEGKDCPATPDVIRIVFDIALPDPALAAA